MTKSKITFDPSFFYRKKKISSIDGGDGNGEQSKLARVLGLVDLTALGVSCTLGSGVYVLVGDVVVNYSGPSIVLSFIVAGIASFLAGLCYAELGARVPTSGSAYVYIYVTIGEFIAFLIGWQVILEYVIGTSSTASALSQYIDSLCGNIIQNTLREWMPIHLHGLADYPDFFSFFLTLLVTVLLIVGVKESSNLNKIFTMLNLVVVGFIVLSGLIKADFKNWNLDKNFTHNCSTNNCGTGGFFPFGYNGVIKGAAKCFYAFIGFDCIATTGEEVKNPKRAIPLSIIITLIVVAISYCSVSAVITLMIPYFMLDANTPFPAAYEYVDLDWAKYLVVVGAIASLITCLYASMFPMPRVVYSMGSDGLIFRFFSYVSPNLRTPVYACIFTGVLAATMSLLFNLSQLIEMMSIGTLLAYTLVAASTLVLRYRPTAPDGGPLTGEGAGFVPTKEPIFRRLFNPSAVECNESIARLVDIVSVLCVILIIAICAILTQASDLGEPYAIFLTICFTLALLVSTIIIWMQPQNKHIQTFKVPFVPFYPLLCVFLNVYLMFMLSPMTWVRFSVWFVLGIIVYFLYAIRKSSEREFKEGQFKYLPCFIVERYGHEELLNSPNETLSINHGDNVDYDTIQKTDI